MTKAKALTFTGKHRTAVVTVALSAARAGIEEGRGCASLTREAQA